MINKIKNKLKQIQGNVLCIGVSDEKLIKEIEKNKKIKTCDSIHNIKNKPKTQRKLIMKRQLITINIFKLKKTYKKTKLNYIFCNINDSFEYLEYILKDSLILIENECIFYGDISYLEELNEKLKRYHCKIRTEKDKLMFMIVLSKIKTTTLKNNCYFILDKSEKIVDKISKIFNS
jgi:hypothetical protein